MRWRMQTHEIQAHEIQMHNHFFSIGGSVTCNTNHATGAGGNCRNIQGCHEPANWWCGDFLRGSTCGYWAKSSAWRHQSDSSPRTSQHAGSDPECSYVAGKPTE